MTEALTLRHVRQGLYDQIPGLGMSGIADSVTGTTLTDPYVFADTTVGANHYRGFYLYRPDLTGDDKVKKILQTNTTTGAVTIAGTAYSNTTELDYELVGLMHPDELNATVQRTMTRIFFDTQSPLTLIPDGDMDEATTSHWSNNGLATCAKVSTASNILSGRYSLETLANSTGDYAASDAVRVFADTNFWLSSSVRVAVGTVELVLWDKTNSAEIASTSVSESGWTNVWLTGAFPTGCEEIEVRLRSATSTAQAFWNHVVFYRRDVKVIPAPSWLDEQFKFLKLRQATYKRLGGQNVGGYSDANSRTFSDWLQPSMFTLDPLHLDANPYQIQLMRNVPEGELWIQAKRPYSDIETLSSEESTTRAPIKQVYAYCKEEIAKTLSKRYPADQRWQILRQESITDIEAETSSRPATPNQPMKREHWGRV